MIDAKTTFLFTFFCLFTSIKMYSSIYFGILRHTVAIYQQVIVRHVNRRNIFFRIASLYSLHTFIYTKPVVLTRGKKVWLDIWQRLSKQWQRARRSPYDLVLRREEHSHTWLCSPVWLTLVHVDTVRDDVGHGFVCSTVRWKKHSHHSYSTPLTLTQTFG